MTLFSPRRTAMILATALAGVGATAAPALAAISDGTSNTIQLAIDGKATPMLNVVLNTIAHGTQVGSEGIIAILIGLLH